MGNVYDETGEKIDQQTQGPRKKVQESCDCGKKRLLIVDDEVYNLKVIELGLKRFDFEFDRAFDGQEAFEVVKKKIGGNTCPNVKCCYWGAVLMDQNMPNMDGAQSCIKITQWLQSVGKDPGNLPIVALSAYNDQKNISYCLDSGMAQFVEKPARKDKLNRLLTDLGILEN